MVEVPVADAQRRLIDFLDSPAGDQAAREAVAAGQAALTGEARSADADLDVRIETMPMRLRGAGLAVPMAWLARTPAGGSPVVLDADVELAPATETTTRISLAGSYRPPVVPPEAQQQPSLLAKATEAMAAGFLDGLARRLGSADQSA